MRRGAILGAMVCLGALAAPPAAASDWRLTSDLARTGGGDTMGFFDVDSFERDGDNARFTIMLIFQHRRGRVDNARIYYEADCTTYATQVLRADSYDGPRQIGTEGPQPVRQSVPNSTGYDVTRWACGQEPVTGHSYPDPYATARSYLDRPHGPPGAPAAR